MDIPDFLVEFAVRFPCQLINTYILIVVTSSQLETWVTVHIARLLSNAATIAPPGVPLTGCLTTVTPDIALFEWVAWSVFLHVCTSATDLI